MFPLPLLLVPLLLLSLSSITRNEHNAFFSLHIEGGQSSSSTPNHRSLAQKHHQKVRCKDKMSRTFFSFFAPLCLCPSAFVSAKGVARYDSLARIAFAYSVLCCSQPVSQPTKRTARLASMTFSSDEGCVPSSCSVPSAQQEQQRRPAAVAALSQRRDEPVGREQATYHTLLSSEDVDPTNSLACSRGSR